MRGWNYGILHKDEFEVNDIKPAAEFAADLGEAGDLAETKMLVQVDAGEVVGGDAGDKGMVASGATGLIIPFILIFTKDNQKREYDRAYSRKKFRL